MSKNTIIRRETPVQRDAAGNKLFKAWSAKKNGRRKFDIITEAQLLIERPDDYAPLSKGQGTTTAISAATGWEYEHDETDAQIDALEDLMLGVREKEGVAQGSSPAVRGAVFSWSSSTNDGEGVITVSTTFAVKGDGVVNLGARGVLEGHVWATETWEIDPDGTVREQGVR